MMKAMETGRRVRPYTWPVMDVEEVGVEAEKAIMAMAIEARVTEVWSQARKVRSLAKKTLGSTLTGTLRTRRPSVGEAAGFLPKRAERKVEGGDLELAKEERFLPILGPRAPPTMGRDWNWSGDVPGGRGLVLFSDALVAVGAK